ncbi:unannotated protein [freshwater metagenome]|uniref:Unannotated protein n=1 Tax=freshwater metagenome TaxID=449393 RepID=A0A6J6XTV8_9ZZZZ
MSTSADLLASNLHRIIDPALKHGFAKDLGPVGIGPLPDGQEIGILAEGNKLVEGRDTGLDNGFRTSNSAATHTLNQQSDVLWRGPTASTHQSQTKFGDKLVHSLGKFRRRQWIRCTVLTEHWQSSVRHTRHR